MSPRTRRFRGPLEMGHKGAAVIVPFDPAKAWRIAPKKVLGETVGWPVRGTMNGAAFRGAIGFRWGRWFIRTDAALEKAAGIAPGDLVEVVVAPVDHVEPVVPAGHARAPVPRSKKPRS